MLLVARISETCGIPDVSMYLEVPGSITTAKQTSTAKRWCESHAHIIDPHPRDWSESGNKQPHLRYWSTTLALSELSSRQQLRAALLAG